MRSRVSVIRGDITKQKVDVIVNAANSALRPGGGVSGAIHRAAGPKLWEECQRVGGCPTGEARITKGHELPAEWVIHTVGPVWQGGHHGEDGLLASCYRNSLELAERWGVEKIAFPSISTGIFGFPVDRAARIAFKEIRAFLDEHGLPREVTMICFDEATCDAYQTAMGRDDQ